MMIMFRDVKKADHFNAENNGNYMIIKNKREKKVDFFYLNQISDTH